MMGTNPLILKKRLQLTLLSPWKKDFPALNEVSADLSPGRLSYLDSAATCQVPEIVIANVADYLRAGQGNAGRGMHGLSERATTVIENCRQKVAKLIHCNSEQITFTKGTTESINLVANGLKHGITSNYSILVTQLEHHSNLLPWQQLCQQTGAKLNVLPIDARGNIDDSQLDMFLSENCALFAFTHCSNVLGNQPNIQHLTDSAKHFEVATLIDGAQAISHDDVNLQQIDCDYYAFSGHKLYAPGGSGILYSKDHSNLEPLLLGGGIVNKTTIADYELRTDSLRLEAGSANLVALTGLSSAIDYINSIGYGAIQRHEQALVTELVQRINNETSFDIVSSLNSKNLVSFFSPKYHCHDVASLLAEKKVAVRAGHHCAQPCLQAIGVKHCLRASFGLYNDSDDIAQLIEGIKEIEETLA
ncbi:MAG: aminotransferase class V-fold PLP-dependent enzyme [Kangiellaceae bacterium]|nr:aminotransferase class V-fold PLP-dependent enzyme [Kangiellaceae bacterium]